jgi:hypothetical protein
MAPPKGELPPRVRAEVQRILDGEARRILDEEMAKPPAERELVNREKRKAERKEGD